MWPLGTNFSEILTEIQTFALKWFESVVCEMAADLVQSQCVDILRDFDEGVLLLVGINIYHLDNAKALSKQCLHSCLMLMQF